MLSYHGKPEVKNAILAQLRAHYAADEIVQGRYWERGKGCAVGCTIHGSDHSLYEPRFGIPRMLARIEDRIFEGLPAAEAKEWPIRFMEAVPVGADLSLVGWRFLAFVLRDLPEAALRHAGVRESVQMVLGVLDRLGAGEKVPREEIEAARSAAWSAAEAAWSAAAAAWSAAAAAAEAAAWSAARAEARHAAYRRQADELIRLLAEAGREPPAAVAAE